MKTIYITTNKGTKPIQLPTAWWEVSTRVYQNIVKDWDGEDILKLFSILTGIEYKTLAETKDYELEAALYESVRFIYDSEPYFKAAPIPEYLELNQKTFYLPVFSWINNSKRRVPKDIGKLSIGQNIHIRQAMDEVKTFDELISLTVAIYMQPIIDGGDFDHDKAMILHEKVLDLPITDTYPVGFFFAKPLMNYGQNTRSKLARTFTRWWQRCTRSAGA